MTIRGRLSLVAVLLGVIVCFTACRSPLKAFRLSDQQRNAALVPPPFFGAPAAALLTNGASYLADTELELQRDPKQTRKRAGRIVVSGTRVFYEPETDKRGEIRFVWDAARQTGFAVNEALQGYAPLQAGKDVVTGSVSITTPGKSGEKIAASTQTAGNTVIVVTGRRTAANRDVPMMLQQTAGTSPWKLTLTKVQWQPVAEALFAVPDGFTKYDSVDAMRYELARRQSDTRKRLWYEERGYNPNQFPP